MRRIFGRACSGLLALLVGASAVLGGALLVVAPSGTLLGLSVETLVGTPFSDFTIPCVALIAGVGCASLVASYASFRGSRRAPVLTMIAGLAVAVTLLFEIVAIGAVHGQQSALFATGVLLEFMGAVAQLASGHPTLEIEASSPSHHSTGRLAPMRGYRAAPASASAS